FAQARPVLEAMGKAENIFYVGPQGTGEVVKLVNNILVGTIAASIAESFVLGVKAGVDVETMAKIIGVSAGASWQLSARLYDGPAAQRPGAGAGTSGGKANLRTYDRSLVPVVRDGPRRRLWAR